jgi:hypothetical protein
MSLMELAWVRDKMTYEKKPDDKKSLDTVPLD